MWYNVILRICLLADQVLLLYLYLKCTLVYFCLLHYILGMGHSKALCRLIFGPVGRFLFQRRLGSALFWPDVTSSLMEGVPAATRRSKISATLMIDAGLRLFDAAAAGTPHSLPVLIDLSSSMTSLAEVVHATKWTSSSLSLVVFFTSSWWRHFMRRFWNQTFTCKRIHRNYTIKR